MKPARARRGHPVVADAVTAEAEAAMEAEAGTVVVAATVASEEATNSGTIRELKFARSLREGDWAGLDSNQRRRKASRFTVCPVWPLRYLPGGAPKTFGVDIG